MESKAKCDEEILSFDEEYYNNLIVKIQSDITKYIDNKILEELKSLDNNIK